MDAGLHTIRADITTVVADAIVNAANQHLAGGGGVDGAIHRRGGRAILSELQERYPAGTPTGTAVATAAGGLPARWVIHAVGPRWRDGEHGEPGLLRSAYASAFRVAAELGARSVTAPSISTGIYGFPIERAAPIAVAEARHALTSDGSVVAITFCLFSDADHDVFRRAAAG